jgi:hypothetical protein
MSVFAFVSHVCLAVAAGVAVLLFIALLRFSGPLRTSLCVWAFCLASLAALGWFVALWVLSGSDGNRLLIFRWHFGIIPAALAVEAGVAGYLAMVSPMRYYALALTLLGGGAVVWILGLRYLR